MRTVRDDARQHVLLGLCVYIVYILISAFVMKDSGQLASTDQY